jgi:hypothetical protein
MGFPEPRTNHRLSSALGFERYYNPVKVDYCLQSVETGLFKITRVFMDTRSSRLLERA